ncbi:response regulator [Pleurocapsales cyanobacterium LEGE 06147]|nr:response regulator [Pleurocapsales cyanobacterium LEGE 06147]
MKKFRAIEILLVEDSPIDAKLIAKVFSHATITHHLQIVTDGVEAIAFLHQKGKYSHKPRPDLILLALHLPKKDGLGVLAEIRANSKFLNIPVIILTTSECQEDIINCYHMDANCYLTKPNDLDAFCETVTLIQDFWLNFAKLPSF